MSIFLGLGGNLGDRVDNMARAIGQLETKEFRVQQISPVVETPAMLPEDAPADWNRPYLNCVVRGTAPWQPAQSLQIVKQIEQNLGRESSPRWAPRPIDIDILLWDQQVIETEALTVPHPGIIQRSFVLTPLLHLQPDLKLPGTAQSVFELSATVRPEPLWMGIVNLTPDSFSDDGQLAGGPGENTADYLDNIGDAIDRMIANHVQIIDLGGESTRPNAQPVAAGTEWQRLKPVLELVRERFANQPLAPWISVDSRHPETLARCLESGIDMINDVSGLRNVEIMRLVKDSGCHAVAMHSMTIPVDPSVRLPDDRSAVDQLNTWLSRQIDEWNDAGLDLNKIIFDPGIGFNKNPLQSLELLSNCRALRQSGLRLLIGHSRKSFMSGFTPQRFAQRDLETLGVSLALCQQGVDIIRVHDVESHIRAHRAWSHIRG